MSTESTTGFHRQFPEAKAKTATFVASNNYALNGDGYVLAIEAAARAEKSFGLEPILEAIGAYLEFADGGGCACNPWLSFTCERHSK